MRIGIDYGLKRLEIEVDEHHLIGDPNPAVPAPVADRPAAMRAALEHPLGFPALHRALTPDDHVTVVVDEDLPHLAELLTPLLEHVLAAGVAPDAVSLLCAPPASSQDWLEELPEAVQDVRVEVHDPTERRKLSYLATTAGGRRIYLNRTAVDADQLIVLARRGYDPLLGYSGSEGALYPALSDEATRQEFAGQLSMAAPGQKTCAARKEALEVAWLLGAPFMVQVIEGAGDEVAHVLAGPADSGEEGQRLLNARWRVEVDQPADTVLAAVSGDPARHTLTDLARALAAAARVVRPGGRIVLLTEANPSLGAGAGILRRAEEAAAALEVLRQHRPADMGAAFLWAHAAQQAGIYVLSRMPAEAVEEMFATPLDHPGQVQRLLAGSCLVLPDAHKTLAVVRASVKPQVV
jgi:nickel-dependent lactate racemase